MGEARELIDVMAEMLNWIRVGFYTNVKTMLKDVFDGARPEEITAYEMLDGTRKYAEIVKECKEQCGEDVKISVPTLSQWTTKWEKLGLVTKTDKAKKNFNLEDFGIKAKIEIVAKAQENK